MTSRHQPQIAPQLPQTVGPERACTEWVPPGAGRERQPHPPPAPGGFILPDLRKPREVESLPTVTQPVPEYIDSNVGLLGER